jgi:hypothetical protein
VDAVELYRNHFCILTNIGNYYKRVDWKIDLQLYGVGGESRIFRLAVGQKSKGKII